VSPDGQKVALVVVDKIEGMRDERFTFSIYLFDVSTGKLTLLNEETSPVWSPDSAHNRPRPNLWGISIKTDKRERLTQGLNALSGHWSPDGKWFAFAGASLYDREDQPYNLWLLSADGSRLIRAGSGFPQDLGVFWSPDGTYLVFDREEAGLSTLSLVTGEITSLDVKLLDDSSDQGDSLARRWPWAASRWPW
jgi:Tol biopolymer transport system component